MSNIVKYQEFSLEELDQQDSIVQSVAGSVYLELPVGDTIVRVLPGVGGRSPFRVTAQHYIKDVPGLERTVVLACNRVETKMPCLGCQRVEDLLKMGDRKGADDLSAGLRVFANVIDRQHPDAGVKIFAFGKSIWDQLKAIRKNARLGGDFTDPTARGFDLIITRTGEGRTTKYTVAADRSNTALAGSDAEIEAILNSSHDLNGCVDTTPPDDLLNAWGVSLRQFGGHQAQVLHTAPVGGALVAQAQQRAQVIQAQQPVRQVGGAVADAMNPFDD